MFFDLDGEQLIGLSPGRCSLVLPGVERALGHAQHTTRQNDRVMRLSLRDESVVAYRVVVLAKKAMALPGHPVLPERLEAHAAIGRAPHVPGSSAHHVARRRCRPGPASGARCSLPDPSHDRPRRATYLSG